MTFHHGMTAKPSQLQDTSQIDVWQPIAYNQRSQQDPQKRSLEPVSMTVRQIGQGTIELVLGDIVNQQVTAIVNAANSRLAGGGGVDGAIHRAAGPELLQWCQEITPDTNGCRCPTGEVRVTAAGDLPARWVLHAVGPVYNARHHEQASRQLLSAHVLALETAAELDCDAIAFPAISTGVYGFPVELAAPIGLGAARDFLLQNKPPHDIRFVLFGDAHWNIFRQALEQLDQDTES